MKALLMTLLTIGALQACLDTDDPATAPPGAELQREVIDVHGCKPGFLQIGDVCIDPRDGGAGGGGPGPTGGEGGPGSPGGPGPGPSGGGGGGADPYPIPAPKDCTKEINHEACYSCCDWNVDKVWGERCKRIPKKKKAERKLCWIEAEKRRSECQLMCPRPDPIVTIQGPQ